MSANKDDITLREYVDNRFEALEKSIAAALTAQKEAGAAALAAAERAVAKAESSADKRFDSVNEFRAALDDNFRTLMPRAESEQARAIINEKIDALTARVNQRDDRGQGRGDVWGFIVGAAGFIAALISIAYAIMRAR